MKIMRPCGGKSVLLRSKGGRKGEGLPPGAPCGVVCGQALAGPAGCSGGLHTASRLRRTYTPFCDREIQGDKNQLPFRRVPDTALTSQRITYLSGKAVQSFRTTSNTRPKLCHRDLFITMVRTILF
jgi:hypothetical protein